MKVLDLRCANGHGFEGWFGSEDDFLNQNGRSLIQCPMCSDSVITRMPSAPRLNLSGAREVPPAAPTAEPQSADKQGDLQALWLKAVRHAMENTDDVGERFAEEARRMHYGVTDTRGIRGVTSREERDALRDEGIEVMSLPIPPALKGPVQ